MPYLRQAGPSLGPSLEQISAVQQEGGYLVTLQDLNARVQIGGEPAKAVAEDYLKTKGFLK